MINDQHFWFTERHGHWSGSDFLIVTYEIDSRLIVHFLRLEWLRRHDFRLFLAAEKGDAVL